MIFKNVEKIYMTAISVRKERAFEKNNYERFVQLHDI